MIYVKRIEDWGDIKAALDLYDRTPVGTKVVVLGLHDPALSPELAQVYEGLAPMMPPEYHLSGGNVAEIVKTHSLAPAVLEGIFRGGLTLINGPSPLSRREREMINTVVSSANRCFY